MRKLRYHAPRTLEEALALKAGFGASGKVLAGGTDLLVGLREESPSLPPLEIIDISRLPDLRGVSAFPSDAAPAGRFRIGPLTTHRELAESPLVHEHARCLAQAAAEIGSPQIRNRGTLGGNLCNAATCADTAPPLVALGGELVLRSVRGLRTVLLEVATTAPYRTVLAEDEILTDIRFPILPQAAGSAFVKVGRRRALSVSRLSIAVLVLGGSGGSPERVRVAGGAMIPVARRLSGVEAILEKEGLSPEALERAGAALVSEMIRITGRRWSTPYKERLAPSILGRALRKALEEGAAANPPPGGPHRAPPDRALRAIGGHEDGPRPGAAAGDLLVRFQVNGEPVEVAVLPEMTLLQCLRERLFLTGTKCGCEIGQCGACTVLLDGQPVASCLVLAAQAEGMHVETVEGLARGMSPAGRGLHPLQEAFLDCDAVACGFCTPGMLMSAKALLSECPEPTGEEIRRAISGNLCRCTGYLPIVEAIHAAARALPGEARDAGEEVP